MIEARDALETKPVALAPERRTDDDLTATDEALAFMAADVEAGGRGVEGDERFHGAVTAAAHSPLLAAMMRTISELIAETRLESLSQPGRTAASLESHLVSDVALFRGRP